MSDLHIPHDIRDEILHKLPIKTLVRFTCVSKSWLSVIKNPNFISISHSNKNPLLLVYYCSKQDQNSRCKPTENFSLYFDGDEEEEEEEAEYTQYMQFDCPFEMQNKININNPCFWLVGTTNGLLCLDTCAQIIFIWNPSIRKSVTLPKPNISSDAVVVSSGLGLPTVLSFKCVALGFGFDSHSNDYKVLRLSNRFICSEFAAEEEEDSLEAEIYSLNMNSWKRIDVPRAGYLVKCQDRMVFVKGVVNVLAFKKVGNDGYRNLILVFDMVDEVFNEIELPLSLVDADPYSLRFLAYEESIAVFRLGDVSRYLWVMKQYGVVQSWHSMLSFQGENGVMPTVLGFRKNGELFFHMPDEEIVSCDPESNKSLGVSGSYPSVDYFVESFELFDNANAQSDDAIGYAAGDESLIDLVPWVLVVSLGVLTIWSIWNRRV